MSTALLSRPPGHTGSAPSNHGSQQTTERDLRRRLAQTRAALEASKRDNEALRRTIARLLDESHHQASQPEARLTPAERKRRMREALAASHSCNP